MMAGKFNDKDVERLQRLMAKIVKDGKFTLDMNQFVELFNEFEWVNKEIISKMKANIMEVLSLKQMEAKEEAKPKPSKAKK